MVAGRSSTALFLLALTLSASSTTALAAAQGRQPPVAHSSYKLITVWASPSDGDYCKLAMRADGSAIAGFANNKNNWFAVQGSEDLLKPYHERFGSDDMPAHGLLTLLAGMLKK